MQCHRGAPRFQKINFILLICLAILFIPLHLVSAAPVHINTVNFDIVSVKMDESVTIQTVDFPVRTNFIVLMGKATNKASTGVISTEINSGVGGKQQYTLPIPESLKGIGIIGVRIESKDGYQAYNWFFNRNQTGLIPDINQKPEISFSNVKKNASATVQATNLPPNTQLSVRVGPYYNFYQKYVPLDPVYTDQTGSVLFTINLKENIKDAEYISVRLDGGAKYLFGTFQNLDGGKEATASELVKVVPCTLLSINPIQPLAPREDFDVIWTIQNTGLEDWNTRHFLFKYREGEEMHKYDGKVFLSETIKRGGTYELVVDMLAPETPGWHFTTWALVNRFDETICTFKLGVSVHE